MMLDGMNNARTKVVRERTNHPTANMTEDRQGQTDRLCIRQAGHILPPMIIWHCYARARTISALLQCMRSSTLPRGLDELLGGLRVKQFMSITTSG